MESYGVCIGTLGVFDCAWLSVMKFCECVVSCLCV